MNESVPKTRAQPQANPLLTPGNLLQRKCACGNHTVAGGECAECAKSKTGLQRKLTIGASNDPLEQEADRVADQVMSTPANPLIGTSPPRIQRRTGQVPTENHVAPPSVDRVLASSGMPLEPALRQDMEQRFGHDFSGVRVHSGAAAAQSARDVNASAYTVGNNVVFDAGRFSLDTQDGQRLIAHELTHVIQQSASGNIHAGQGSKKFGLSNNASIESQRILQRQQRDPEFYADLVYEEKIPLKAQTCGRPSWCPPHFCTPYADENKAKIRRSDWSYQILTGISLFVDGRVMPLWREYYWGGSPTKNLTAGFGKDFTNSPNTQKTTNFLYTELKKSLAAKPPSLLPFQNTSMDIATQIPTAIAELDDPGSPHRMNFDTVRDIPGNIAGDIGKNQTGCSSGAQPSSQNDERHASGYIYVTRFGTNLMVTPMINYTVKDTIDLCPGNCGGELEQKATLRMSQFETTGISGDVPFTVNFPAPSLGPFTVSAPAATPTPTPAKPPKKP